MNASSSQSPQRRRSCILPAFRRHMRLPVSLVMTGFLALWTVQVRGATLIWDADGTPGAPTGGTDTWDQALPFWDNAGTFQAWNNAAGDTALFGGGNFTVTLGEPISAAGLIFKSNYRLQSAAPANTLTLTSGTIQADLGTYSTIASQISGTAGLTLTGSNTSGRGTVRLTNSANDYTGTTTINSGTLIIDSNGALGTDTSTVVINGVQTPGLAGGSLMLAGNTGAANYGTGFTVSRNLSMTGGGGGNVAQTAALSGSAIVSVGSNTISGQLTTIPSALGLQTGAASGFGTLTLSNLSVGGTAVTNFTTLGSTGSIGGFNINGTLAGTGSIQKTGFGTLILNPTDATGFSGTIRVNAGSVRVSSVAALGTNTGTGTNSVIDLNGGVFEIRADSFNASTKGVDFRAASTLFVDHAVGSTAINGAAIFGNLLPTNNVADTFNSRNGFSTTFNAMTTTPANANGNVTLTNNGSGLVTLIGSVWGQTTNNNTLTVTGSGDFQFNTGITASGGTGDVFNKSANPGTGVTAGTGTLTITGTGSTFTGATSINAGTLVITDFRSLNLASASTISIGSSGTGSGAGTLTFGTTTASTAAGLTSAVNGTTIATSGFAANATTVTLASTDGVVVGASISGTGIAPGTTVAAVAGKVVTLSTPAIGAGTANQAMTVAGVTTTRVIDLAGTTNGATINANQTAAFPVTIAAATPTTTVISASGAGSKTLTLGGTSTQNNTINGAIVDNGGANLTSLTKTDGGVWQLAGVNTYTGSTTISGGTLKIKANAGASTIIADASAIIFNANATTLAAGGTLQFTGVAGASTENLGALTPTAGAGTITLTTGGAAANLVFASLGTVGKGSGVNFLTSGGGGGTVTVTGVATTTATTLPGNGHLYINGSNFARSNGGVMVAPVYGTDAGFVTSASALTASSHNQITGSFSNGAASVTSLKIAGSQTLTMTGNLTVNTGAVANDGGILVTGGSAAISGAGLITTGGGGAVVIRVDGASDVLTLNTNIASSTTGGLTKNGAGKLVINAVNAQTGTTSINEGTVQLAGAGRISAANAALDLRQGATLDLNGLSTGVAIGAFNGAGTVTNTNAAPATLVLYNATTGAGIFSGVIQDGAGVTNVSVTGTTGTPTWSGLNTYTGVTTIGTGLATTAKLINVTTLANIGTASSIGRGLATDDATNAASLVFGGLATAGISYTGTKSVSIDRLFTLNGNMAGAGGQIANASGNNSALIFSKTNPITFGASAAGVAQTLTLGGSSLGDSQFNLQITNNGATPTSLNKIGAGLWWLGNTANTYTGTTTITQGYLNAQDGTSLPNASGLILGATTTAGVLETSGDFTRNIVASGSAAANTVSWNASLTTAGSGFSASTSKLRVALGGVGTETPLVWAANGFAVSTTATAPLIFNSTTALSEVEFRNAIDLNGATRTIQVDDNTTTFTDFATITGVISNSTGAAGISKSGAGMLQLLGANTYNGSTAVTAGTLVVTSLGDSVAGGATSVGTATGGNALGQGVILGNATTTAGILNYVGPGETSDRYIGFNGTTAGPVIVADGTGPLILTNVNNNTALTPTGAKTLSLRGANNFANTITSVLSNDGGGGVLTVTHDTAGTWILSGANTYTGATTVSSGGTLGAGNDQAFGVGGALTINNGNIFASGADRTIANPVTIGNTTNAIDAYIGDYSLTFNGAVTNGTTSAISRITRNNLVAGKTLTFNGNYTFTGAVTGTLWNFDGSGQTILNGAITQASAGAASTAVIGINYAGTGSLTLGNTGNAYLGATTISNGTLKLGTNEVVPDGVTTGAATTTAASSASTTITAPTAGLYPGMTISGPGIVGTPTIASITSGTAFVASAAQTVASGAALTFSINKGAVVFNPAVGVTAKLDLNGVTETVNAINGTAAGTMIIDNSAATGATLIVGGADATGTFNGSITRSGGSGLSLTKIGAGTATFAGPADVTAYNVQAGALKMTGGQSAPGSVTGVTVAGGATLQFFDGVGTPLPNLTTLDLGGGSGTAILELDAGTTTDTLTTSAAAIIANTVRLNIRDVGLTTGSTYPLLVSPSGGLGAPSNYVLGPIGGYSGSTLTVTANLVQLNLGTPVLGSMYWTGNGNPGPVDQTKWNAVDGLGNGVNWSSTKDGLTLSATVPGAGTTVVFQADSAPLAPTGQALATTLEQSFRVNNLIVETSTNTLNSLSIGPGAVSTNRLTIQPGVSTDGIEIKTGTAKGVIISSQLAAGANQTWTMADFNSVALSGGVTVTGNPNVTVADTSGLVASMQISGPGIPTGATIISITDATHFVMSANATGANAALQSYTATSALTASGGLFGSGNITKAGSGRAVLSGSGTSYTGTAVNITGGILETQNVTALAGVAATPNTGAAVTIGTGGEFRHNSATAGIVANPIVLNGGLLSSGGFTSNATTLALTAINHTYSGNVSVAADSTIHLADLATHASLAHTITLSGLVSGSNKITLDSVTTATAGNQISGTLTINNGTSTWNGPLAFNRGTVVFTNAAGGGILTPYAGYDGAITFDSFGRVIYRNVDGGSLTRSTAINYAAGAVGEFQVDNLGALASNYTITQNGAVNLNTGSIVRFNMADAASNLILNGGVVLNGNASITATGGDADSLLSINTVGISGAGDLAINDEAGVWAVTSSRVAINAAGTYTGNTTLNEGTLILGHKDALSAGSLTITAASTITPGIDLSAGGSGPVANALNLGANLTIAGSNNLTFSGVTTQSGGSRTLTNNLTTPSALLISQLRMAEPLAAAARTLTIAGTGATSITTLVNNDQDNILTNSLTTTTLNIGTIALSDSPLAGHTLTLGGAGNTIVSGVIENVAGGGGLAGGLTKAGTGILTPQGANTFTGDVTLTAGTVEFATVSNLGGPASNLGQGTNINLAGGILNFIGSANQSTDRPMPLSAGSTLAANGSSGATITYNGAIAGASTSLTLDGAATGILNSVLTQTGTTADLVKNGTGTWSLNATNTIADDILLNAGVLNINITQAITDDIVVTGTGTVLNLNAANAHQGDDLFIRSGAVVNLGINGALSAAGMDALLIGDSGTSGAELDLKGFTSAVNAATIGVENTIDGTIKDSVGGGSISSTAWTVRNGSASAALAGATMTKNGAGTFTLSGSNTFTGATTVTEGSLILDYTTNNTSKIAASAGVVLGGAAADANPTLTFSGNAAAPTTQAFTTLTVNAGSGNFVVNSNGGQAANVNFTTITRGAGGTVDFTLPAAGAVTTTQALNNGILGGYATVSNGAAFATKDGSNVIGALVATLKNDVTTWTLTDNVTDDATGFTGTVLTCAPVNSVTFTGVGSTVNTPGFTGINTGGILVTSTATGAGILGGVLTSGASDVIVNQYAAGDFTISSSIRGINAITKTGTGALVLSGSNTANGAVNITEGLVKASGGSAIGDTAAVNLKDVAGSGLQLLASETIGNLAGGGTQGGNITLGTNTLTVNQTTSLAFNGQLVGNGTLVKQGTANLNLATSSNTGFTGTIVVNQGLVFASGSAVANLPAVTGITVNAGGAFMVDNNGAATIPDRVNNSAPVSLASLGNGAFFGIQLRSDQDASTTETMGALQLLGSSSAIAVNQNGGTDRTSNLTFAALSRQNNATIFIDGKNLAATSGNNRGRVIFTTAPALVGGTGVVGGSATNVPIIRFAVTLQNTANVAVTDVPNTFAHYTTTGVTPLNIATEYKLDAAGYAASVDANDNLRFTTGATGLATQAFNAIVFDSSAAAMTVSGAGGGTNVLTVGSGAMLFTSSASANGTTLDTFDSLTPGANASNEWIITTANTTATINSVLTDGTAATALTKSGSGTLILGGTNTYTGATYFNQGIVKATTLANLGNGGALNFFGGTLQFGGVFDPSARAVNISAIGGGATFDTNGNDIVLANAIGGGGSGSLTKTGLGNLTLNAAATHTGGTTVLNGTLTAGVANMLPAAGSVTVNGATAALDLATFNQTAGTFTLTNGAVNGTATLTASDYQLQAGTIASTVVLAGAAGVTKTTTSTVALGGSNTFSGPVAVQAGVLSFDSIANANGTASALGAPATVLNGAIQMGLGTAATGLTYTGAGHSSDRQIALVGTTGATTISANGTGALVLGGAVTSMEFGAKSLVLRGTSTPLTIVNKISAPITECFGVVTLQKLDSNTWQLDAASTYTGATQIDDGVLRLGINNALPVATAVRLGTGATAGVLDLNGFNQTIGSLTSSTNSATATSQILVQAGNTLTINGAVTLGANVDVSTTLVTASGGGAIIVNSGGANFQVGGATGGTNENTATVDFTGLASFTANLGAGTFRIGDANTASGTAAPSTMKLAPTSTITAAAIRVGDGSGFASNHTLVLGSGVNTLNADTVSIGSAGAGIRSSGTVQFDAGDTTGSVQIRASDGTGRATINMVNTTGSTSGNIDATANFAGHTADVLAGTVTMATRSQNTGAASATLTFDQGTMDITTLNMAARTSGAATPTGNATGTVNLGDSAAPGSPTTTIGTVNMAVNTSGGGTVTADLNVTGGTVNLGPVNMANASAGRTATATLDITGGTTTLSGNITRTGGGGTENATITLDGGTLDMAASSIGTGSAAVSLVAASGTLKNLGELNGGGVLDKTTGGTLVLEGTNTYTGATTVSAGTLQVGTAGAGTTGTGATTVNATGTLAGTGTVQGTAATHAMNGSLTPGDSAGAGLGTLKVEGSMVLGSASTSFFTISNPAQPYDKLNGLTAATSITLDGAFTVNAPSFGVSYTPQAGDVWDLIDWASILGVGTTFDAGANLRTGGTGGGDLVLPDVSTFSLAWDVSNFSNGIISLALVPEPSRMMLIFVGLLGLVFRRRRAV